MYKKLTCLFCFAISIFIFAVVLYLLLTDTHIFSDKPPEINVPKIALYVFNPVGGDERILNETPNSDYILYLQHANFSNFLTNEPGASDSRRNVLSLRIKCHSNYPVQLKYFGFGNITDATNYNRRQIEDISDRSTYVYSTELEFGTVDEGITGKYDCQVRDENVVKASTFIYIYASGSKSFVSNSSRELIVEPDSVIEVPCPVTHSDKSIILTSVMQLLDDTIVVKNAEPEIIESFNPKLGFVLQPNSFGSFVCKDEKTGEYSGRVTIFKPLSNVVKGKTLRIYSQNVDNQHVTLKVACRATEPVELKFINFIRILREVKETKNFSQEFPHTVRIKLNVEWFRGNTSVVECITKRDRRVIKTWKFLKHDLPIHDDVVNDDTLNAQVFLQSVNDPGYQCCSNHNYMRPVLRTYPCHTPTECELRLPCLSFNPLRSRTPETVHCPLMEEANEAIYEGDSGCTKLKVSGDPSGVIRCLLDTDSRDYIYFTGMDQEEIYASMSFANKKKIDPSAILKISQKGLRGYSVQNPPLTRFECAGSKLYFASGFQWGVKKMNEPIKYLIDKGHRAQTNTTLLYEWIDVPYSDTLSKRFYCFAPLINPPLFGQQWVNVSVAFRHDL